MKYSSKYVDSRPNVYAQTEVQHRIKNIENKHNCTLQKSKPEKIQYKTLNEGNVPAKKLRCRIWSN
jgi:hypothetical protein